MEARFNFKKHEKSEESDREAEFEESFNITEDNTSLVSEQKKVASKVPKSKDNIRGYLNAKPKVNEIIGNDEEAQITVQSIEEKSKLKKVRSTVKSSKLK